MDYAKAIHEVQLFIKACGWEALEQQGIRHKVSEKLGLAILDYNTLNPNLDWSLPYAHVCRGLVLDAKTLEVVAFGFPKFFNLGEPLCANIDWKSAVALEKLDGTMVQRFWHDGFWRYSTRFQLPDDLERNEIQPGLTWQALINKGIERMEFDQRDDETVVFELTSPVPGNKQIVEQLEFRATEILRRSRTAPYEEMPPRSNYVVKHFIEEDGIDAEWCLAFVNSKPGTKFEGVVVVDRFGNRAKVKNADYVRLHFLKAAVDAPKNLILAFKAGEVAEVKTTLPEYAPALEHLAKAADELVASHQELFDRIKPLAKDRKEFALLLKQAAPERPDIIFKALSNGTSVKDELFRLKDCTFVDIFRPKVDWIGLLAAQAKTEE